MTLEDIINTRLICNDYCGCFSCRFELNFFNSVFCPIDFYADNIVATFVESY